MRVRSLEAMCVCCLALAAWTACASPPTPSAPPVAPAALKAPPPSADPSRPVRDFRLPEGWDELDHTAFAAKHAEWTKDDVVLSLDDTSLHILLRWLAKSGTNSVRAAVILASTRDPRVLDLLLERLEARVADADVTWAGDIVAAAGCAAFQPGPEVAARIEALAIGPKPHPVFLVRVECALTSLTLGRDAFIPFLLDLLREGTSAPAKNPNRRRLDWTDERDLRLQDRIAHALSARAGIECAYRARGPLAAREKEIARIAQLLQGAPAPK